MRPLRDDRTHILYMKGMLGHNAWQEGFTMPETLGEQLDTQQEQPAEEPAVQQEAGDAQEASVEEAPAQAPEQPAEQPASPEIAFSWQASEYVHNHKGIGWYGTLAVVVAALVAGCVFLHLWLYVAVFITMGIAVVIYAHKPPRVMMYELSGEGIHIEGKLFPFSAFRSFSVTPEEEWHSIDLEPTKRFSPRVVLLFDNDDFDSIVGHLELHLPRMDRLPDMIERITRYVRF